MATLNYRDLGVREIDGDLIEFEVLPEHVKLLRNAKMKWNPGNEGDNGAPTIDPVKPYGSLDLFGDIAKLTEVVPEEVGHDALLRIHQGTAVALQIAIVTGKFKAGIFRAPMYSQDWKEYRPKAEKKGKKNADSETSLPDSD
jgi:hypothetical protein